MRNFTLRFIQIAWVAETIVLLFFTILAIVLLPVEKVSLWLQFIPLFTALIVAQGTAAGVGPLMSDHINKIKET